MKDEVRILALPMTAAYFRLILRRFGTDAGARRALLAGTGAGGVEAAAPSPPDAEIAVRAQLRQLANLSVLAPPEWGLLLGAALDGAAHGPAGTAIVTAGSLGDAIATVVRFAKVRTPFVDLRLVRERSVVRVEVVETCRVGAVRTSLDEMVLLSLQGVVESALGRRLEGAVFTVPRRPPYARRYPEFFHAPVRFGGPRASLALPAAWLDLPCPLADAVAHRSACERLEAIRRGAGGDLLVRIATIFATAGDAGVPLAQVAAQLRMSSRTLVRRLSARSTSFREQLEAHRRRRAAELLSLPELSIAEIAERLGYEEPTNFSRACRRWFGAAPRRVRAAWGSASRLAEGSP